MRIHRPSRLALLAALSFAPAAAQAQAATVSALRLDAHHELLGDALMGAGALLTWPRAKSGVAFQFGVERLGANTARFGIPCAGLIQPGTCPQEALRDRARLTGARGGAVYRAVGSARAGIDVSADLALAHVRVETRGLASGSKLSATKLMWGPRLGATGSWEPISRVPVALEIGASVGGLTPLVHQHIVDGYAPFENDIGLRVVHVGLSWRTHGR